MTQKTALVTGGARGIGLATAKLFLEEGRKVAIIDRDASALEEAAGALREVLPVLCDVSIPEQVDACFQRVMGEFGRIDALVNNAGVAEFGPLEEHDFGMWRRVMATNVDGVFLMSQACAPALKDARGAIVNIASISGLRASTLRMAYGTSKAAVIHMTKQQAAELGEFGVRANCVAPGPVATKLSLAVHSPEIRAAYHDGMPLGRYGSENEIAGPVVWLCSEQASFVTGQVIASDGGFDSTGVGLGALRGTARRMERHEQPPVPGVKMDAE